jgi:serine/threonine-protein kinase
VATFGRYEILDKLGEGAMGVVYRARDLALGRPVALKMLSEEFAAEEELHQRFRREVEAVGQLSHPNIVSVYDMDETDGRLYMAMELLEGDDLRTLIERHVSISLAERVRIFLQICAGLGYAHGRGIVHRDIKPANILVTSSGQVKLLDFGLARLGSRASITRRGVILGTPDYMAPEQAQGRAIDARTDLFSAGAVLYEFLTLQKPFRGKTLHAVLYQIISGEPEPVLSANPEVPARLAAIVHRMLAKDPERRYPSLEDVARELRPIHAALRRSRSRSAWPAAARVPEDARGAAREHLAEGRARFESGLFAEAAEALEAALGADPDAEEAAELLWQAGKRLSGGFPRRPDLAAQDRRVAELLAQAGPGAEEEVVRRALLELALIAPDDPRVQERLRTRSAS